MDISFVEFFLIGLIAFLVLGPKELIRRSYQMGQWVAKARTQMNNYRVLAQEQVMQEKSEIEDIGAQIKETKKEALQDE